MKKNKKVGAGKMLDSIEESRKRYTTSSYKKEYAGAFKVGTHILALMSDNLTYHITEILAVRESKFFKEEVDFEENEDSDLRDTVTVLLHESRKEKRTMA